MSVHSAVALAPGKSDPGFIHDGPLASLGAVCAGVGAGAGLMYPVGALLPDREVNR
jgi:hypothetical protein